MSYSEQQVRLAARMYEMRDTARNLHGERYAAVIEPWKRIIAAVMKRSNLGCLEAALLLIRESKPDCSDVHTLMLTAAAVELIEPGTRRTSLDVVSAAAGGNEAEKERNA